MSAAADAQGGWLRSLRGRYLRLKAGACERFGATDRCIRCLEELAKLDPGDVATWRRLQALLAARGDAAGSVRCLEKLAALSPADLGPVKKLAEAYFTSGDYARALPHFEKLRARNPTDARALTALGEIHLKMNDPTQARGCFQELVVRSKDRNALRWLFKVGQLFLIHQKHEEALKTYRGILEAVPGEPTAQLALSKLTYQGGDLDEAVRIFGSVPEDGALTGLGEKLRHAMKLRDASLRELILEGRATEPPAKVPIQTKDGSFFVNVPEGFARTVKPVYSIDEQRMIRRELIRLYLREGLTDRALFHLTQYRPATPAEGSWVAAQRALALTRRGELELARAELDRVVFAHFSGRSPSDLDLIYEAGHTYLHCGNPGRALEAFKRLLLLDVGFKDVEQLVERLRHAGAGAVRSADADATKALSGASAHSRHEGSSARLMGPYELGEPIRAGWMGELFAGRDPALGRAVVLRRLPPEMMKDPALKERFATAARAATGLAHPNLVTPLDIVEPAGELWIVTEQVSGVPADALVKERALPAALVAELGAQAAAGLAAAHERKILHRDLKASDFLVDREAKHLRVLDVGIAGVANTLEVAPPEYLARRAHYMPPEFILGERVDEKGDVYSLGILLFLLACGRYPHPEGDLHARLFNYLEKPLPSPREVAPAVSTALEEIVLMCLSRDRARRPTAHALSVRLAALRRL